MSPRASKLACRPMVTNMGWLSHRSACGNAMEEEDEEEVEDELASPGGGGPAVGRRGSDASCERCSVNVRDMQPPGRVQ